MATTIVSSHRPLDASQADQLRKLFVSPEFTILKELLVSKCIEAQLSAVYALVYPNSPKATNDLAGATSEAVKVNALLDLLDDLEKNEEKWTVIQVEQRRI